MARRVLDTTYLVQHWRRRKRTPLSDVRADEAETWAKELIGLQNADAIVTPIYIEFVAGVRSAHELVLARAYLAPFRVIDDGSISNADWKLARRIAERVPRDGKPRQLGDCLIKAIATRLNHDVESLDVGFPR